MAIFAKFFTSLIITMALTSSIYAQDSNSITFYRTHIYVDPDDILQTAPVDDFMASKPKTGRTETVYLAKNPTQLNELNSETFEATLNTRSFHPDVKKNKDFERVPLNIVQEIDISDNEKVFLDYNGMVYLVFINNGETKEDKVQMATALTYEKEAFDYIFLSDDFQLFGIKPNLEVMQFDRSFLLKGYEKFKYYFPNLNKAQKYVVGTSAVIGLASLLINNDTEYLANSKYYFSALSAGFFYVATNLSLFLRDLSMTSEISNSIKRPYMFFNKTGLFLNAKISNLRISRRDPNKSLFDSISYDLEFKNGEKKDLASLLQPYGKQNSIFTNLFISSPAKKFKRTMSSCLQSLK